MSPYERPRLYPLGDHALVVAFGDDIDADTNLRVRAFSEYVAAHGPPGIVDHVPAFATVTVLYQPRATGYADLARHIQDVLERLPEATAGLAARTVEIPVCYGGDLGPDLPFVADHNGLTPDEVVAIHSEPDYHVYMIGFVPGFPYMGGMSPRISAPRRDSPRDRIPAGSVGIAGEQTGVYPIETPGGWQLIGRTPLRLFRPHDDAPSLLQAGDRVRFAPIDRDRYEELAPR